MDSDSSASKNPLQHYVGRWRGEVSVESAGSEPQRYTQDNSFEWILGELFLEERGTGSNGSAFIGLWSRDGATGKYRAYYFMAPTGDVVVLSHEWRESSQSFVGSAELGGGVRMLAEDRFFGRDEYEWNITVQDSAGNLLTRMRGHERRVDS
jgi:hypothetical protein